MKKPFEGTLAKARTKLDEAWAKHQLALDSGNARRIAATHKLIMTWGGVVQILDN